MILSHPARRIHVSPCITMLSTRLNHERNKEFPIKRVHRGLDRGLDESCKTTAVTASRIRHPGEVDNHPQDRHRICQDPYGCQGHQRLDSTAASLSRTNPKAAASPRSRVGDDMEITMTCFLGMKRMEDWASAVRSLQMFIS